MGRIVQLGEVEGSPAPFVHCPRTILMVTRMGATYTALGPRTRPTRFSDRPAWMQEIIDREEQEQQDAHERETRTGRHHPFLLALAERERVAQDLGVH